MIRWWKNSIGSHEHFIKSHLSGKETKNVSIRSLRIRDLESQHVDEKPIINKVNDSGVCYMCIMLKRNSAYPRPE